MEVNVTFGEVMLVSEGMRLIADLKAFLEGVDPEKWTEENTNKAFELVEEGSDYLKDLEDYPFGRKICISLGNTIAQLEVLISFHRYLN